MSRWGCLLRGAHAPGEEAVARASGAGLVLLAEVLLLAVALRRLGADLLVVLLEGRKVLTGLGELTLLHTLADVPVNERALGVHEVKLVVKTSRQLTNGGGVGDHDARTLYLGQVTSWNNSWWLVVDTNLEGGWAPVNELDGTLRFDGSDGGVDILWYNVTTVHQNARHVLTVAWVTLQHWIC